MYQINSSKPSGQIITDKCVTLLENFNCKSSVVSMVFDTTALNTGHISGACVRSQMPLRRPLLWTACLHHIGEIILVQIFKILKYKHLNRILLQYTKDSKTYC